MKSARRILHQCFGRGRIRQAAWALDATQATDFIMERPGKRPLTIAWRVRQAVYLRCFQDVTIRTSSAVLGKETEIEKLRRGAAKYYLSLWTDDDGAAVYHVLWDVKRAAKRGLFDRERRVYQNEGSGASSFIGIPLRELRAAGCVVAEA